MHGRCGEMQGKCRVARASAARLLYVRRELVVRVVALLRRADLDQLHLVELVPGGVKWGVLVYREGLRQAVEANASFQAAQGAARGQEERAWPWEPPGVLTVGHARRVRRQIQPSAMLPHQAARVAPARARLRAEARRIGHIPSRRTPQSAASQFQPPPPGPAQA